MGETYDREDKLSQNGFSENTHIIHKLLTNL